MIPKILWQTHKWEYEDLPYPFRDHSLGWQKMNPDWEYRYVSDNMAIEMIKEFSEEWGEDLLEIYERILSDNVFYDGNGGATAHKADLWRYLTLYTYGGIYVDMDTECIKPLSSLNLNYKFVHESYPDKSILRRDNEEFIVDAYGPHFFGCSEKSFMLKIICSIAIEHLRSQKNKKIDAAGIGPALFTESIKYFNGFNGEDIHPSLNKCPHGQEFKDKHHNVTEEEFNRRFADQDRPL